MQIEKLEDRRLLAGDVVTFAAPALDGFDRWDPHVASEPGEVYVLDLLTAGLFTRDLNGIAVPEIASGFTADTSSSNFIFALRDDFVFHDGEPVTAADAAFSLNRLRDIGRLPMIHEATATDEVEVTVALTQSFPAFVQALSHPMNAVLSEDRVRGNGVDEFAIRLGSAGPYQLAEVFDETTETLLVPFADYPIATGDPSMPARPDATIRHVVDPASQSGEDSRLPSF